MEKTNTENFSGLAKSVYHMEPQVRELLNSVEIIEESLRNQPSVWTIQSISALIGVFLTFTALLVGYIDIRLEGHAQMMGRIVDLIEVEQEHTLTWRQDKNVFQREVHYEMGVMNTKAEDLARRVTHDDELGHERDRRLNAIEERVHNVK